MVANNVFTLTMQIKGSVPHVTGSFAPVTAHEKPLLEKKLMMMQMILIMLDTGYIKEASGCIGQGTRGDEVLPR